MNNMEIWEKLATTPPEAQKPITAGRLNGFTDINPMWRLKALTALFGPCGIGWKMEIKDYRIEHGAGDEQRAFVLIHLYYRNSDGGWSEPVPGFGGASFVTRENKGPYTNDECYKMALSDAIGTACKALGMSADIFYAKDRSKYNSAPKAPEEAPAAKPKQERKVICRQCGNEIKPVQFRSGSKKTVAQITQYSETQFGMPLCYACTMQAIDNARAQS